MVSGKGCICRTSGYPTVSAGIVSATVVKIHAGETKDAAPGDHFAARPHCCLRISRRGRVADAASHPAIVDRVISAASVYIISTISSTPDDHFAACPHRSVVPSCGRRVRDVGSYPTVRARIVSSAAVQVAVSTASVSPQTIISLPVHTVV